MTPEAQRIAIAEACGFVPSPCGRYTKDPAGLRGPLYRVQDLPDYLTDLNAMHEAEKVLTEKQELWYLVKLMEVMKESGTIGWRSERTYKATAPQRAEAFLRTLNLWTE